MIFTRWHPIGYFKLTNVQKFALPTHMLKFRWHYGIEITFKGLHGSWVLKILYFNMNEQNF